MKHGTVVALALLGLVAGQTAMAQSICGGASAAGTNCGAPCSNPNNANPPNNLNDDVMGTPSAGKFNVGGGNQGDGNDGFNNQGNFNVGSANAGNCNLQSGGTVGSCDPSNSPGQIVLRFCNVFNQDPKCNPGGYLPEFTPALITQIQAVVASCNGGATLSPPPPASPPPPPSPPTASPPPPVAVPPTAPGPASPPAPGSPGSPGTPNTPPALPPMLALPSDSTANLTVLLSLFEEHILQAKAAGRKMLL